MVAQLWIVPSHLGIYKLITIKLQQLQINYQL